MKMWESFPASGMHFFPSDNIPTIPDLEEFIEQDLTQQVAKAPKWVR